VTGLQIPYPDQIRAYLTARNWREETPHDPENGMFVFGELSDDGLPITLYVPDSIKILFYPLRVSEVIDTVSAIEGRSKDAIRTDLLSIKTEFVPLSNKPLPTPRQVRDYLRARGWQQIEVFPTGRTFEFERLSDDGQPITVFVPGLAVYEDYPRGVSDVIDTVSAVERRSKDAVRADLLATNTAPATSPDATKAESVPDAATQPLA